MSPLRWKQMSIECAHAEQSQGLGRGFCDLLPEIGWSQRDKLRGVELLGKRRRILQGWLAMSLG